MLPEDKPTPEREQTDKSLRVEREKADNATADAPGSIDEAADAVLEKARARADAVLATARRMIDRQSAPAALNAQSAEIVERARRREDEALDKERADADEAVRAERAEHAAELESEREETDKDLSRERARSDDVVATRDAFLGIVSHDLRNMLSVMIGFAGLIAKGLSQEHPAERMHAHRIQRSGARMNRLIGDLLDVASIEAGMLAVIREVGDPTQVVLETIDTFQAQAAATSVTLIAEVEPRIPPVAFDSARILQVLVNLISNAIKFTPPNGRVVVRVERIEDDVRFAVRDTGVGVPKENLESIFERFVQVTTNDPRGVGLGLYISKCIVQGHGGRIWAESTIGEGSTFSFTLPAHSAA